MSNIGLLEISSFEFRRNESKKIVSMEQYNIQIAVLTSGAFEIVGGHFHVLRWRCWFSPPH